MSLKKRMFRSNMAILFTALLSLMMIILAVLFLFEDSLETQLHAISQTRLDQHVREVAKIVDEEAIQSAQELQKRVEKWNYQAAGKEEQTKGSNRKIAVQDVVIEPRTWKVWKKDEELKLPNREFELLRFLAENPNIVFSKEELFEKIWGYDYVSDAATVSVHINRLREKIEDDARNPKIIETVWGAGYRLNG